MASELRIRVYGSIINLFIKDIHKTQKEALLQYCRYNNKKLKRVWYFADQDEQKFMKNLFHMDGTWHWTTIDNISEVRGPVVDNKDQIKAFLTGTIGRPQIQEIYLNGEMNYDPSKIRYHYHKKIDLPKQKRDHVFVYYGFIDRLGLTYRFKTQSQTFNEKDLSCHFTDCGEYGILLSSMLYEGNVPEKSFRGSKTIYFLDVKFG
jgi:hypothetical protein